MTKKLTLEEKEKENIWDHIDSFLKIYKLVKEKKWSWIFSSNCKYVNLRIDMRDGGCIIMDRDGKRISPEQLEYQWKDKSA